MPGAGRPLRWGVNWYPDNFVRLQLNAIDWTVVGPDAKGVLVNDHGQSV